MTRPLPPAEIAADIEQAVPGSVAEATGGAVYVKGERLLEVAQFLKESPKLAFDYLVSISGVDRLDHFEVVYHLVSIKHNHSAILKTRCHGREGPELPSVITVWQGADFQEREVYDLLGVRFNGHPNMKRIMLWEGFEGYPLRKDFIVKTPL